MGKLSSEHEPTIKHFSHQHPLSLSTHTHSQTSCSACKLNLSPDGLMVYTCTPCDFNLHLDCAKMPQQIKHQSHRQHALALLPKPAYPEGFFCCKACGKRGNGFSYHCTACKFDLHVKCASMPLKVSNHYHHHGLELTFVNPYGNDLFSCDICKNMGSKEWLYRCNSCEFDCHLNCARMEPRSQVAGTQLPEGPNFANTWNNQGVYGINYADQNALLMNQLMQQMASNRRNGYLQAMQALGRGPGGGGAEQILQAMMGGGHGGGGADILQAMMGGGYGGGGGAQGANILQAMMGGGYGGGGGAPGADILQAMMGGGGGGGMDFLQAMMGGGSGGGGAGNLLQSLMGGGGGGDLLSGLLGGLSF